MLSLAWVTGGKEEETVDAHVVDHLAVERITRVYVPDDKLPTTVTGGQHPSTRGEGTRQNTTGKLSTTSTMATANIVHVMLYGKTHNYHTWMALSLAV